MMVGFEASDPPDTLVGMLYRTEPRPVAEPQDNHHLVSNSIVSLMRAILKKYHTLAF